MSEIPSPVSESTAIEIVRREGTARSFKSITTITAGDLLYSPNNSGASQAVGAIISANGYGVALYDCTSGNRVVTIRGKVRARWDGAGTVNKGTPIQPSTAKSGYFEPGAAASGGLTWGFSYDNLGTTNSGLLNVVEVY